MKATTKEQEIEYVEKAKQGDSTAFEYFFKKYHQSLNFKVNGMVMDKQRAEDIVMETFEKAFENLDKYQPSAKFGTWLFKIAQNHTIDNVRANSTRAMGNIERYSNEEEGGVGNVVFNIPDHNPTPEEQLVRHHRDLYVREMMSHLPQMRKRVLELKYFDGLTSKEISEMYNVSDATIRAYIFDAKTNLREIIIKSKQSW